MNILIPVLLFAGMGLLAGVLLTVASKVFHVETDPKAEQITAALPGANCGGCGFAGCADYAAAVAAGKAAPDLCRPGGAPAAEKIGAILGIEIEAAEPVVMTVHCQGDCNAVRPLFDASEMKSCAEAKGFYGGGNMCSFGCLGLGDCAAVCEAGAISVRDGLASVDPTLCTACGKCAKVCPNQLLSLRPVRRKVAVLCSSAENGRLTQQSCTKGCLACRLCVKKCPKGAVSIEQFHAKIDYEKCVGCGLCATVCPTGAIAKLRK